MIYIGFARTPLVTPKRIVEFSDTDLVLVPVGNQDTLPVHGVLVFSRC